MKQNKLAGLFIDQESLPSLGAWIETFRGARGRVRLCRSLHWGRGLKRVRGRGCGVVFGGRSLHWGRGLKQRITACRAA